MMHGREKSDRLSAGKIWSAGAQAGGRGGVRRSLGRRLAERLTLRAKLVEVMSAARPPFH
jgi:hypothetical protein